MISGGEGGGLGPQVQVEGLITTAGAQLRSNHAELQNQV